MTETRYYLAIDIGASSGRHVLGHVEDGKIVLEEVHRFDNIQQRRRGHDCWDVDMLWKNVLAGIENCRALGKIPESLGIDTWGVDFVLLDAEGKGDGRERAERMIGFGELADMARQEEEREEGAPAPRINVNDERFLSPASMIEEVKQACRDTGQAVPETTGAVMRCVYESLTACYAESIAELARLTGRTFTSVNVVGGGCQDTYLNECTARACGLPVYAGPIEGTSLGNLLVQMIQAGEFTDLQEARNAIHQSFDVKECR